MTLSNVCVTPESYTVFVCLEVSAASPPYDCDVYQHVLDEFLVAQTDPFYTLTFCVNELW